jgi:hypothetical protein
MRVVVSINGVKFRVPITDGTLTVGWLCGDVAARYQRHHKLESGTISICELRGSDGSLLDATDAITDVADDMEELVGVISTTTHIVYSDDKEVGYSRASVVPEPPPGGNPMGLAANQHALRLAKEKGVEEVRVRGADEGMRMPADRMAIAEELLDSWAADAYSVLSCDGHPDGVTCLHLAHDMLLSAGRDRLVRVWDMQTRRCRAQLQGHTSNVRCLGFARGILVSGGEAAVRVWELGREMSQTGTLLGHNHFVSALSLDDDLRLVTASWDRTLRIWHVPEDGTSAQSIATLGAHTASVLSLRRVGDRAVSGSLCGEIFLWNLLTEQLVLRANSSEGMAVNAMMWERNILFCAADMDLHIIDTGTGRKVETLKGHTDVITSLVVSMPWVITGICIHNISPTISLFGHDNEPCCLHAVDHNWYLYLCYIPFRMRQYKQAALHYSINLELIVLNLCYYPFTEYYVYSFILFFLCPHLLNITFILLTSFSCVIGWRAVETCIFFKGLFLIWSVRSVENKTENKRQKKTRDKRKK